GLKPHPLTLDPSPAGQAATIRVPHTTGIALPAAEVASTLECAHHVGLLDHDFGGLKRISVMTVFYGPAAHHLADAALSAPHCAPGGPADRLPSTDDRLCKETKQLNRAT